MKRVRVSSLSSSSVCSSLESLLSSERTLYGVSQASSNFDFSVVQFCWTSSVSVLNSPTSVEEILWLLLHSTQPRGTTSYSNSRPNLYRKQLRLSTNRDASEFRADRTVLRGRFRQGYGAGLHIERCATDGAVLNTMCSLTRIPCILGQAERGPKARELFDTTPEIRWIQTYRRTATNHSKGWHLMISPHRSACFYDLPGGRSREGRHA
jgi:hypothetical protein